MPGSATAAATEGKNGTVPVLSAPLLAFLAVRHVVSQTQLCPFTWRWIPTFPPRNLLHRTSSH
jgi:hypothetical protein